MSQNLPLAGRIAVITGASSGIGEAAARKLAEQGAAVALLARRKERLDSLAADLRAAGGRALPLAVDATDRAAVAEAARTIAGELGAVDLVLNNAGVMLPSGVDEHRVADFEQMIAVNLTGVMRIVDAFVDPLVAAARKGGPSDLINISSIGAHGVFTNFAVYCATKAAVTHLSRNLRAELGPKHVRVSVIEPGFVNTELQSHMTDEAAKAWIAEEKRRITWLTAADVANTIAFTAGLPRHVNLPQITIMPTQQV
ncbi:short-chain dehydrogenase [Sorangium cellulosum]|uniref:Short-chain dehydrogenase n=1 Tax=Sorangium cellulosum TaxID=56 RepID=A0A4P2QAT0_SORCE|nr:SDR family oxidoreductase [Sorangium cellulosum]AUX26398.1 short-chain dehydrogenase [Sorangium cellulosum]